MTDKQLITEFLDNWPTPEPPVMTTTEGQLALVEICRKFEGFLKWASNSELYSLLPDEADEFGPRRD